MNTLEFKDLRRESLHFSGINSVQQRFPNGSIWSGYINTPRPSHGLVYVCSDTTLIYEIPGRPTLHLGKGSVLFAPKGSFYKVTAQSNTPHTGIDSYTVNFCICDHCGEELSISTPLSIITQDHFSNFPTLLTELTRACYDVRPSYLKIQANFLNYLDAVMESAEDYSKEYYIIRRGVEQLALDWNKQEKISKYAEICGISQCYFNAMFRNWAGVSPVEYRNRLRVSHARSILQSGSVSIAETAALVGFDDPFYFSRIFKSITGISPQVYKRDRFIP